MKNIIINIVITACIIAACEPPKDSKTKSTNDSIPEKQQASSADSTIQQEQSSKPKEWKEFEIIYSYVSAEVKQQLGIINLTADSIEFRLLTEDGLCNTQYWGSAKNLYPDQDTEIDEDENGEAYPANEFTLEDEYKIISIRVADSKDKARIKFTDKTNTDTDCFPHEGLQLRKTENAP